MTSHHSCVLNRTVGNVLEVSNFKLRFGYYMDLHIAFFTDFIKLLGFLVGKGL